MREGSEQRLAGLDGIRAFAICAVILFHWGKLFEGWAGVWVFFVLSGFVNTRSLLTHPHADRRRALVDFWHRRTRRIVPLYLATILVGAGLLILDYRAKPEFNNYLSQIPWMLGGVYNFDRMLPSYQNFTLLSHLWSLSVEFQFYALLPFAVLFLSRKVFSRLIVALVVLAPISRYLLGLCFGAAHWTPDQIGTAIFQFSPGHLDAFALGAYIATIEPNLTEKKALELWTAAGLFTAACVASLVGLHPQWLHFMDLNAYGGLKEAWVYTAIDLLSAAWIAETIIRPGWLAATWLQFIGKRSYGIYMIHYPLLWGWNRAWPRLHTGFLGPVESWVSLAAYFVVLIVIADLSYRQFERRFWAPATGAETEGPRAAVATSS